MTPALNLFDASVLLRIEQGDIKRRNGYGNRLAQRMVRLGLAQMCDRDFVLTPDGARIVAKMRGAGRRSSL